jgi:tetratricopeptide (TPR) repeat protein
VPMKYKKSKRKGKVKKLMPMVLMVVALLMGSNRNFAQERHVFNQEDFDKFKLAQRLCYKGEQLFNKGKYKKAEKVFADCLKKFPKYANADYYMSRVCYEKKDYTNALKHIENATNNFETISDLNVSFYLEYLEKLREQQAEAEEYLVQLKENLASLPAVVDSSSEQGKRKRNIEDEISRTEGTNNLIKTRLAKPVPEALEMPVDYYYVHGNILFRLKKYKDALGQYHRTVEKDPKHGNAYNNLASLYFMAKQYKRALFYLEKAESAGVRVNEKFKSAILNAMKE